MKHQFKKKTKSAGRPSASITFYKSEKISFQFQVSSTTALLFLVVYKTRPGLYIHKTRPRPIFFF
jgi:hypothetical protein